MELLFIGDIVGRPGRQALKAVLPQWREQYAPDLVVANVDNLAHGKGMTMKTLEELTSLGVEAFTTGDHGTDALVGATAEASGKFTVVRPLNAPIGTPGVGARRLTVGSREVLLVHVLGQVFMRDDYASPFRALDDLLAAESGRGGLAGIIVDVHAEATSEKVALGWYLDGRVTAVLGTHTHVPTADAWVMPQGTAYITDVGMVGDRHSVIGVKVEQSLARFLTQAKVRFDPAEGGPIVVNAVRVVFEAATGRASRIEPLREVVAVA